MRWMVLVELIENIHLIKNLYFDGLINVPNEKGIYVVLKPEEMILNLLPTTTAITSYNNRNLLYDLDALNKKYNNSDKTLLYIGKAGGEKNKLKSRIGQLVRYGYGEVDNHRGGRAIWQIQNNKDLLIGYFLCNEPNSKEKELLEKYKDMYGVLPLANWKIG